ncbi:MAG: hypothetical protein AAGI07_01105, partial [Bacteroidota bacterium]
MKNGKVKIDIKQLDESALQLAIDANKYIYDEYMDLPFAIKFNEEVIDLLTKDYFRAEYIGFEELPERKVTEHPIIFAGNHSGMAFPWDAIIFLSGLFKRWHYQTQSPRPLTAPMLSQSTLMNPFLIPNFWKKMSSIDANMLNFETMMQYKNYNLLMYPEGVPGIGKGFQHRYRIQRMATSFIRMSLKYKTDIIPVYTINGEYINPYHYTHPLTDRLINKLGIPFLPLGWLTIFLLLQPWLFYIALPAKLFFIRGKRIDPSTMIEEKPYREYTQLEITTLRDKVHTLMQSELSENVKIYGKKPYQFNSFFGSLMNNFSKLPFLLPPGWPLMFSEFYRKYKKYGTTGFTLKLNWLSLFTLLFKNPFVFFYFIPILGWVPILIKGLKK